MNRSYRGYRTGNGSSARNASEPDRKRRRPSRGRGALGDGKPLIAVFGSSAAQRGGRLYEEGYRMGLLLGRSGFNVMTGGYTGLMEATSRGAHQGGAQVIGITLKRFEERPNRYVMKEVPTSTFYARFRWLVDRADGYIAMQGGMGTLAEVSFAWQMLALAMLPQRPFIMVGAAWKKIIACWLENLTTAADACRLLTLVATPQEACNLLSEFFAGGRSLMDSETR